MALSITKIDDKADGFTCEFQVTVTYRQTFPARPANVDQMLYAKDCVQGLVKNIPVEKPEGVFVVPAPLVLQAPEKVIDLTPPAPPAEPLPPAEPPAQPPL